MKRCCEPASVFSGSLAAEAALFKALGDPHRLTMLATLARADGEVCVCDFTDALPLEQPTVSHHLRILREAGLVVCERRGTWAYYRLAPDASDRIASALRFAMPEKAVA
ncbi:MAG TPA: metalloregulator ArsR/SmtB family transcription factor [Candidatus Elarobacter sp.]|jgi:ArsR family transcriptional regulator|nr:metalloregulator ArsR/SmtB family transcription factor [Candidatus Elarobacter sp.]